MYIANNKCNIYNISSKFYKKRAKISKIFTIIKLEIVAILKKIIVLIDIILYNCIQ